MQVFAKDPQSPKVKTRLQPMLGQVAAQQLYHRLCWQTLETVKDSGYACQLWTATSKQRPFFRHCQQHFRCHLRQQRGQDLGQRMQHALEAGLRQYRQVILIGSDCPEYTPAYLRQAATQLQQTPVVIGKALDGGYVLIAMQGQCAPIFNHMPWSQADLRQKTQRRLQRLQRAYSLLPALNDLDTPLDLIKNR